MTLFTFTPRSTQTAAIDPGHLPETPADSYLVERFDKRLATVEDRTGLILARLGGLLDEVQALGRKVDASIAASATAAADAR